MKHTFLLSFIILISLSLCKAQGLGVGTTTPHPSALLDLNSTNQGFLPPRMTVAERDAIASPAVGLIIWCTTCAELQVYSNKMSPFSWVTFNGGNACAEINLCNRIWMGQNLDVSTYRNGDPIPEVNDPTVWNSLTTGAWCWVYNDLATGKYFGYGKLYNWYAVNDPRGLAPAGWHVATYLDWSSLQFCANGNLALQGGALMKTGTTHWTVPNTLATNTTGFSAVGAGLNNPTVANPRTAEFREAAYFWTSTLNPATPSEPMFTQIKGNTATFNIVGTTIPIRTYGYSVRCVKDNP